MVRIRSNFRNDEHVKIKNRVKLIHHRAIPNTTYHIPRYQTPHPMKPKKIIINILKALGLILIISLERVVGLPLLFILFSLIWLDQIKDELYLYPILLIFLSYVLTITYNVIWPISLLGLIITTFLVSFSSAKIKTKNKRFFIMTLLFNLFWLWWTGLSVSYLTVIQFVISYLIVIMWMRLLKLRKS